MEIVFGKGDKMKIFRVLPLLVIILLVTACTPEATPTPAAITDISTIEVIAPTPTFETYHLTIAAYPYLTEAPYFIAQEEGYFAEQGLEVEFIRFEKSADVIPALIAGQLDVTTVLPNPALFNSIAGGANIRIVAGKGYVDTAGCSHVGLMVHPDVLASGSLDDPENWVGLKFSTDRGALVEFAIDRYLIQNGISMDQLAYVEMPITSRLEALQNGSIDIAAAGEPWITRIRNAGAGEVWVSLEEMIPDSQYAVVMYGPSILEEHPEIGVRFMTALLKAIAQYNEGKTERNIAIIAQYTQMDPVEIEQSCWQSIRADGDINLQSLLDYQTWAIAEEYVTEPVTGEMLWDPAFVEAARLLFP
jgi:NitT/TauT family transport system substrate-binding protein